MNMKHILSVVAFFATLQASAQQVNPVPDYVFRNQMSVGRNAVTDTAAYFSIGPRYGATKGFMPPIVGDTATFSSYKRNGLLIFSVQKNKFLYWDSVRVQWSDMAGSSGSYITGSGLTGYIPQFSASTTLDTSALYTLGNRLGIGTSTFAYTSTNTANAELNGTAGGILGFKRNDSARGYLWHTGDNMELANTVAGSISFNTNSATRGSISSAGVWRLHNLAGTGDRVVQASSNGTLSASTSVTGLVDTLTISTRAWRQKGIDSVSTLITARPTGTGTNNYVVKWTGTNTQSSSQIFDNGTFVGIGTATPGAKLDVLHSNIAAWFRSTGNPVPVSVFNSNSSVASIGFQGSTSTNEYNVRVGADGDNMIAYTNNTERMRIFANGRIGVNTTTDAGYQVDVNGSFRNTADAYLSTASGNVFVGATTAAISNGLKYIYNEAGNGSGIGPELILHNTVAQDAASMAVSFTGVRSGAGVASQIRSTRRGILTFHTQDLPSATPNTPAERMRIDAVGNVGIGTQSPTQALSIARGAGLIGGISLRGNGNDAANEFFVGQGSAGVAFLAQRANADLSISTNNTTRLYIQANGRVGINTATDAGYQFDVNGTGRVNGQFTAVSDFSSFTGDGLYGATALPSMITTPNGGRLYFGYASPGDGNYFGRIGTLNGVHKVSFGAIGPSVFAIATGFNNTERLRVDSNGNVGIGTTSPSTRLHISQSNTGDYASVILLSNSANTAADRTGIYGSAAPGTSLPYRGGITFHPGASGAVSIHSGNNSAPADGTRMYIQGNGRIGINTTTDAGYQLDVNGNTRVSGKIDVTANVDYGINIARTGTNSIAAQMYNSTGILYYGVENSAGGQIFTGSTSYAAVIGSGANYPLQFATNNATRATINTNGELLINTTTDNGDFKLQVNGNALISGSIKTANGGSSTAVPWHLGSVVATSVQLDTGNYVEVEINGVYYRLAIVTPL